MSLTAFVVVALHGARTLLPSDSPELPLLVRPISPSRVLVPIPFVPCAPISHIPTSLICPQSPLRPPSVPPSLIHPYPPCSRMSHVPQCPPIPPYPLLSPIPPCPPVSQCPLIPLCPLSPGVPHVPVYPHVSLVPPCPCPPVSPTPPCLPRLFMSPHSMSHCHRTNPCPEPPRSYGAAWSSWGPMGRPSQPMRWHWWTPLLRGRIRQWNVCGAWPGAPTVRPHGAVALDAFVTMGGSWTPLAPSSDSHSFKSFNSVLPQTLLHILQIHSYSNFSPSRSFFRFFFDFVLLINSS